jgi:hypothetical protein
LVLVVLVLHQLQIKEVLVQIQYCHPPLLEEVAVVVLKQIVMVLPVRQLMVTAVAVVMDLGQMVLAVLAMVLVLLVVRLVLQTWNLLVAVVVLAV